MDGTKEVFDEAQILPIAKSNANIQNNAQPTPTGAAKVFFILSGISVLLGIILWFYSMLRSGPMSGTLFLLGAYNSTNKK